MTEKLVDLELKLEIQKYRLRCIIYQDNVSVYITETIALFF